jgi:hypothetical protein
MNESCKNVRGLSMKSVEVIFIKPLNCSTVGRIETQNLEISNAFEYGFGFQNCFTLKQESKSFGPTL